MFDWKNAPLRGLHLCSALVLGLYVAGHVANHVVGLAGQQAHTGYMHAFRQIYRHPLVEPVLLILVCWQAVSGLAMAVRGWKGRRGAVAWAQALSGLYLAAFLVNHVGAVLVGRFVLGLDTDFRFAAAGFFVPPWQWFFYPYYFLAVVCLFLHVGCALYWQLSGLGMAARKWVLGAFAAGGAVLGGLIVLSLGGVLHPVDIPAEYRATYGG